MPRTKLYDEAGNSIDIVEIDGKYICDFNMPDQEGSYRSIRRWRVREDDVLVWAYPKSGTHWLWDILYQIYRSKYETVDFHKSAYMLEGLTEDKFDALPSPRVLNSHIDTDALPEDFLQKRCKMIYVVRNPKDVAVSFYHHHQWFAKYNGNFDQYLKMFLDGKGERYRPTWASCFPVDSGSWFDHIKQYEELLKNYPDYPIHLMYYEDLHTDGINELKRLMGFLHLDVDNDTVTRVYEKNKFYNVKKDKQQLIDEGRLNSMWIQMYRKGKTGDWKNTFTVEQNEMFDAEYSRRMKDSKVSVKWS